MEISVKWDLSFRCVLLCALFTLFIAGPLSFPFDHAVADAGDNQLRMAPPNPEFLRFFERDRERMSADGYPLGYIPPPADLSHVKEMIHPEMRESSYPSSYDLRTLSKLTNVKNQDGCGSCWAFGTYASLESYLKPEEERDFSEQDLNADHGFDWGECDGGNAFISQAYLARWSGPLNESDVPYPYALDTDTTYAPLKHVQQVVYLPERTSTTDNDTIKHLLTTYGALYFAFYYSNTYWNWATNSYYDHATTNANHAVAVVGWDDNYDKNKFNTAPPGNGAFIAKNSWGTGWGEDGFFYISYYDVSLQEFVSFNNAEATSNYDGLYQYDPLGYVSDVGYGSTTAWAANVFTATDSHSLSAVGFITNDINTAYTIYVYRGVTAGQPRSGTLAATKAGTNAYPGYYTVELDSPVALANSTAFSIVINFENTSYNYPIPVEYDWPGYSSTATSNPGESLVSYDGNTWQDLFPYGYGNNTIKGFFSNSTVAEPTFKPDGGAHPGASVNVTVSCATSEATIRYTADGTEPTESSPTLASSGTVSVPVPGTLKAKAWKTGMNTSDTKTANYAATAAMILYVSKNENCDGKEPCYPTIQAALNAAGDGATIKVGQGQYPEAPEKATAGTVSISGGWDGTFTQQTGTTEMYVPLATGGGTVKLLPNTRVVAPQ